jgi:hypothetical protein
VIEELGGGRENSLAFCEVLAARAALQQRVHGESNAERKRFALDGGEKVPGVKGVDGPLKFNDVTGRCNEFIVVERRGAVHCSEVDGGFEGSKKYWHVTKHFAAAVRIVDEDGGKNGLCRGIERCSGVGDDRDRVSG